MEAPKIIFNPGKEVIADMMSADIVGFDIETSISKPREGRIRLYQLYLPKIDAVVMFDSFSMGLKSLGAFQILLNILQNADIEKRIQNALFEYSWIREKHQIKIKNTLDTLVLNQLNTAGLFQAYKSLGYSEPNSLKALSDLYNLGLDKEHQSYDYMNPEPLPESVLEYAANDAKATWLLGELIPRPKQDIDLKMTEVFGELNYLGLPVNVEKLDNLHFQYSQTWQKLQADLVSNTGCNPSSPKQLLDWIDKTYGTVPQTYDRKAKIKKNSTNKSATNQFIAEMSEFNVNTTNLKKLQHFRSIKKCADYPKEYLSLVHNSRVSGNYRVLGFQGEGRSSCKSANLQNVAKGSPATKAHSLPSIRSVFEASPGKVFIEIDLAAAHAQIARYYSADRNLNISRDTGIKLHFFTLQNILKEQGLHLEVSEIKKAKGDENHQYHKRVSDLYHLSKTVFYSFLNFSGAATLQEAFSKEDVIIDVDTCRIFLEATAKAFADLRQFQKDLLKKVESRYAPRMAPNGQFLGLVSYLKIPDGSIVYFPQQTTTASKICSAVWLRVEATAMKNSLLKIYTRIEQDWAGKAEIVNFSHDSIMLHVNEELAIEVGEFACRTIETDITEYVPDYQHEYEFVASCPIAEPSEEENKEMKKKSHYFGYEIKKNWSKD